MKPQFCERDDNVEGSRSGSHWPLSDHRPRGAAEVAVPSVVL